MTGKHKKRPGRPQTGRRRPVIAFRVHEDVYEAIKKAAAQKKLTLSEEAAQRLQMSVLMDQQKLELEDLKNAGVEEFLRRQGYSRMYNLDGSDMWAKDVAVAKLMGHGSGLQAMIERAVERALRKVKDENL